MKAHGIYLKYEVTSPAMTITENVNVDDGTHSCAEIVPQVVE